MIRILELFGGIGACTKAMERLGIEHEIADYVEIDKYAVKSFNAIHNTNYEPQDICEWNKDIPVDFIMHGSPCQDFSIAGKQAGGDEGSGTRSSLLYETLRIVEKTRPKVVLWENVKNLLSAKHKPNWEKYCKRMEELGYRNYAKVLNAKDYGIPQNRERVYTMSIRNDIPGDFEFPEPEPLTKRLKDVLETDVDEKYYIKDATSLTVGSTFDTGGNTEPKIVARTDAHQKGGVYDSSSISPTITATTYKQPTQVATDTEPKIIDDTYGYESKNREYTETCPTLQSGRQGLKVTVSREISKTIRTGGRGSLDKHTWDLIAEPKIVVGDNKKPITELPSIIQKQGDRGSNNYSVNSKTSYTIPANPMSDRGQLVAIKTATKAGYDLAQDGDGIDLAYPQSTTRRGRVGHGVAKTLATSDNQGTLDGFRIRKLTPKECWRLMGFDDADFDKAEKVNSNTQLYKQAGNSIVVNVLEKILANLPKEAQ